MDAQYECGLDEAGRGPLAGPVTAACVLLPSGFPEHVLGDSKVLTERKRLRAYEVILEKAAWGLGWCDALEIDQWNILQASLEAMRRAYFDLRSRFPNAEIRSAVVDGLHVPHLDLPARALVRADSLVPAVSAASILAKVSRDDYMVKLHQTDPRYGFNIHKGYPTALHREALERNGPSAWHRQSFHWKPVGEKKRPPDGGLSS